MNYKQAFALGLIAPGMYGGQPVAYLYNGVQLPALPEWDKGKYPYAVMTLHLSTTQATLYVSEKPLYQLYVGGAWWTESGAGFECKANIDEDKEWVVSEPVEDITRVPLMQFDAFWTNTDILNDDGTLYLAKSAPIPVYE